MLTIFSKPNKNGGFCDGVNRRDFLTIGGAVAGGLCLPGLLQAEAEQRSGTRHKSIINVYLPGGPPHLDMWDIKVDAPAEIRGEFAAIKTNVAGIEIGECFPKIAAVADKCVFIRTMVGATGGQPLGRSDEVGVDRTGTLAQSSHVASRSMQMMGKPRERGTA